MNYYEELVVEWTGSKDPDFIDRVLNSIDGRLSSMSPRRLKREVMDAAAYVVEVTPSFWTKR